MKVLPMILLGVLMVTNKAEAQTTVNDTTKAKTFREEYEQFKQKARTEYETFRDRANREYAEFVRQAWEQHQVMPAIPKPKPKEVPPTVMPEEDKDKPIENRPVPIEDEIVIPPVPEPQPLPVSPIREQPVPQEKYVEFSIYGTTVRIRFNDDGHFKLSKCTNDEVAEGWKRLSGKAYDNTIRDCLEARLRLQLSDWAYLEMLQRFSETCLGKTNEATLLMAYLYCQSGYQMRMGISDDVLYLLYASKHAIYNHTYFKIADEFYYAWNCSEEYMNICEVGFPHEKPMSLLISQSQLFTYDLSPQRTLASKRYPDFAVNTHVNKNLIDFYNHYPASMLDDNFMTRWAIYANTPMDGKVKDELYPVLRNKIKGLSEKAAMERLLNWVQTAFVYEYDDTVWGYDRAFYPEETLYYPYCDCEDRSIFLSRLVRDLLGLKVILVYYPGHLAMAVRFTENVEGDYIMLNGMKFVVCDPTYIGAPVGETMPDMDNQKATVILLE